MFYNHTLFWTPLQIVLRASSTIGGWPSPHHEIYEGGHPIIKIDCGRQARLASVARGACARSKRLRQTWGNLGFRVLENGSTSEIINSGKPEPIWENTTQSRGFTLTTSRVSVTLMPEKADSCGAIGCFRKSD